jgi:glycosyltransferase involved in cell wall biosynthesis
MSRPLHISIAFLDDPLYKQSCIRVAESLSRAGYIVTLIGRRLDPRLPNSEQRIRPPREGSGIAERSTGRDAVPFKRVRFRCLFRRGKGFYLEMNLRVFVYLLFHRVDLICAVNLDTILPCWAVSVLKHIPRVYDARELFTELVEVVSRPRIQKAWLWVERTMVPRFPKGYAVSQGIADELGRRYGVRYPVVRNLTILKDQIPGRRPLDVPYLLYQGAVNYGRGLDALVPAMRHMDLPLVICGTGNYMTRCLELVKKNGLEEKIIFTGQLPPRDLIRYTYHAYAGVNLVERAGLNQYYSLPNKLFDYIHAGIPQVTMDYPEYRKVQEAFEIGILIPDVEEGLIVAALRRLTLEPALYERLRANCRVARLLFNWQEEEKNLISIYQSLS